MTESVFPRNLSLPEQHCLLAVLPEKSSAYGNYRAFISAAVVTGTCGSYHGNLLLAPEGVPHDAELPASPVIALGEVAFGSQIVSVSIQEQFERYVEVELSPLPAEPTAAPELLWSTAFWQPTGGVLKELAPAYCVGLTERYSLVFCGGIKKIVLHDAKSGLNTIIPASGYHNELLRVLGINAPGRDRGAELLFERVSTTRMEDFRLAFWAYNKIYRRAELPPEPPAPPASVTARHNLSQLFSRN